MRLVCDIMYSYARESILESWAKYEIIEEYRMDKYLPSYLVHSGYRGRYFTCSLQLMWKGITYEW